MPEIIDGKVFGKRDWIRAKTLGKYFDINELVIKGFFCRLLELDDGSHVETMIQLNKTLRLPS